MGCCMSAPEGPPEDYEEKRQKIIEAAEGRIQAQERKGVSARGAAKLKQNATAKPTYERPVQAHPGMTWKMG